MRPESDIKERCQEYQRDINRMIDSVGNIFIGQGEVVREVFVALIAGGHVLIEGLPGLGKTLLVKTLADVLDLSFSRIQFTPDLMPADIIGTTILHRDDNERPLFTFQKGPLFTNILLADEINRATSKTQSALLEAMQEYQVTTGGNQYPLDRPFFVLATQNPIEMEGTYPLPEAQMDRFFFKIRISYPAFEDLEKIIDLTTSTEVHKTDKVCKRERLIEIQRAARMILVSQEVKRYAIRIVLSTHRDSPYTSELARRYIRYSASPRGIQALILGGKVLALQDGRFNVSYEDIRRVALPALRHRLLLNFEGDANNIETDEIISDILKNFNLCG